MLFSKANLTVGQVASKSDTDRGINCVRLNGDGSTVAANGKVLMAVGPVDVARTHFPDVGEQATPGTQGVSLSLDLIDKAVKNLPKDKRLQTVAMTQNRDARKIELTTSDMRHEQRVAGYPMQDPFPDWKALVRRVRGAGEPFRVCLNRRDIIDLLSAMEEACPDKGGENPVYLEINPQSTGMVVRCVNRETGQRAIGALNAYKTEGHWLPADGWERTVLDVQVKKLIKLSN